MNFIPSLLKSSEKNCYSAAKNNTKKAGCIYVVFGNILKLCILCISSASVCSAIHYLFICLSKHKSL